MGWSNDPTHYWLMCTVSGQPAHHDDKHHCNLPTEEMARKRLGLKEAA